MVIISIANQKGGVSKTTTTQTLATLLNNQDKKTLVVDLDPQGNLSFAIGANIEDAPTIYNVLKGELDLKDILQHTASSDILPSNILLSGADTEFTSTGREYLLKEALQSLSTQHDYDYIIIDCPPSLSILTINAFAASDYIIIPSLADVFSLQGMSQLNNTIQSVKKYCNPDLKVAGILLTRFNQRTNLSNHIKNTLEEITKQMETKLFKTCIRNSISTQEAQLQQENILNYDKKSTTVIDYENFLIELEETINVK